MSRSDSSNEGEEGASQECGRDSADRKMVTLSRADIAFLSAIIEELREEDADRIEGVTLALTDAELARWTKVIKKVTKKVTKATKYTWITDYIGDIFGVTPELEAQQKAEIARLRDQLLSKASLDDLIELRRRLEGNT